MTLKNSYAIELTPGQETFLKVRFNCQTDKELRNVLQRIANSLIEKQWNTFLDDRIMKEEQEE